MGIKIGDVSPLAGMMTGKGAMGKLAAQGFGGILPSLIARDAIKEREAEAAAIAAAKAASVGNVGGVGSTGAVAKPMKNGGTAGSTMNRIRKPTEKEASKLEESRQLMRKGIEGEQDFMSKISTTMAKSARDDMREAKRMRESVSEKAREYEAYQGAGYKAGGKVGSASKRADGCAVRGKTKGKMV
jgi:hypothetical protein